MIASIINTTGATIVIGTDSFTVRRDHVSYASIIEELNGDRDPVKLRSLLDVKKAINTLTQGKVEVRDDKLYVNGAEVTTGLATRILALVKDNQNGIAKPLISFLENVMQNPSFRAVQGLYEWLEKSDLPITDDGCFIAWKIVGPDFKDLYTHTFDNSPGKVVEVQRNQVDEDPNRTCSYGLHFCSSGYLPRYGQAEGNKVVMVKVDPRDVVAFPQDYNTAKGRCAKYTVLQEVVRDDCPTMFTNEAPVFRVEKPVSIRDGIAGFYTASDGTFTFFFEDDSTIETATPVGNDYDFEDLGLSVRVLPSGRVLDV